MLDTIPLKMITQAMRSEIADFERKLATEFTADNSLQLKSFSDMMSRYAQALEKETYRLRKILHGVA